MAAIQPSVSVLAQFPGTGPYIFERVNGLLGTRGLARFRAAVAYARWDGIALIAEQLESFLKLGGELQTIYGIANGVTTPDSLLYNVYLQEMYSTHTYAGVIEDEYANATFHPKFFEFKFADRTIAIIGSANLTGAGLSRNTEMGVEFAVETGNALEADMEAVWRSMRAVSRRVTVPLIRTVAHSGGHGSEQQENEKRSDAATKPRLSVNARTKPKPLFVKVLAHKQANRKSKVLAKFDPLTEKPTHLYLQILAFETGGQTPESVGYQIQLPVATLGAFFGIGAQQEKRVTFRFPNETITVRLTHFENNTHRVRLKPLREVPRPAVVKFRRMGLDEYECTVVQKERYAAVLAQKCTQQTRVGARRWGLE